MEYLWLRSVTLGSFSALVSKWHLTHKRQVVERNGLKFGTPGLNKVRNLIHIIHLFLQCAQLDIFILHMQYFP